MPILNYTTTVEASNSINQITACLVAHGATAVLSEYDENGYIVALSFKIRLDDQDVSFRLPSDWRPVKTLLEKHPKVPRRLATQEQALKVAWRILKDWVEAQMAIVEVKMVKPEQVFLPYIITRDNKTMYEKFVENPQLLLGNG